MALIRSLLRPSSTLFAARYVVDNTVIKSNLVKLLAMPSNRSFSTPSTLSPELKSKFDGMVKQDKVVVFMKGVPDAPMCGFSNAVVQILKMHGAPIAAYDVLSDEELRNGIKEYSNWPTIPQIYIDGTFVGGCDILLSVHRSRELVEILEKAGIKSSLADDDVEVDGKCKK